MTKEFSLEPYGIQVKRVFRNASPARLYEEALRYEEGHRNRSIRRFGGRCRARRRAAVRKTSASSATKAASPPTMSGGATSTSSSRKYAFKHQSRARPRLPQHPRIQLYVVDGYAGWDPKHRLKVRVVCARAYHALFMYNMLIRPERRRARQRSVTPDYVIYNAGQLPGQPA
jgi:phosphoenolpyruvate carboxykinase (ATP)